MEATWAEIFKSTDEETRQRVREDSARMSVTLRPILGHVADRLFDADFDVNALKRETGLNSTTWPLFRQEVGTTPWDYISRLRIEAGEALIKTTDAKLWMIADALGYESEDVFSARFKKLVGASPKQVRERARTDNDRHRPQRPDTQDDVVEAWCQSIVSSIDEFESALGHEEVVRFFRRGFAARTAQLFETLCEHGLREGRRDPQRGLEIAELAVASAEGSASTLGDLAAALHARGLARLANARRLANDYPGAERELRRAEVILRKVATIHRPAVKAEIIQNRGTLRRYQRRFAEAREDLHRAVGLSRSTGQARLEALAWMQLAATFFYEGDPEAARTPLLSASRIAETAFAEDLFLRLGLVSQLACVQAESGHANEALVLLPEARRLAADLGHRVALLQADWIEALARKEQGNTSAAEELLIQAYKGFLSLGETDHTAIVSLDLALLYEEQNRSAEVISLAAEALPALEAIQLPETVKAFQLLRASIARDHVPGQILLASRKLLIAI